MIFGWRINEIDLLFPQIKLFIRFQRKQKLFIETNINFILIFKMSRSPTLFLKSSNNLMIIYFYFTVNFGPLLSQYLWKHIVLIPSLETLYYISVLPWIFSIGLRSNSFYQFNSNRPIFLIIIWKLRWWIKVYHLN